MTVQARRIDATSPDALALLDAMVAGLAEVYGADVEDRTPRATAADFSPPGGAYVALYEDGRPVGGGGLKRLAPDLGELKRMYVVPVARGRGLARVLLAALEDAARDLGYARLRLDTGPHNVEAQRLYDTSGYARIPDYNGNGLAVYWAEKKLR
jgi:GNAT superfamily N-acetyltransferase